MTPSFGRQHRWRAVSPDRARLGALMLLMGAALWCGVRAIRAGEAMASAYVASLVAFLASAVFDCPLDVPRLATLIYLIAFAAIAMGDPTRTG